MSVEAFKKLVADGQLICPKCNKAVQKFHNYVPTSDSVWDGAGDSLTDPSGSIVTLICGNDGCSWEERTEYWDNYTKD